MTASRLLRRVLHPLLVLAALALVFEEWLWDRLKAGCVRLAHALHLHRLESLMRALPPWASLLVMLLPGAVLFPFKMLALYALSHGHPVLGGLAFVGAKVAGTAAFAYVFEQVRDNARRIRWFDALYRFVTGLLGRARACLHALPAVVQARALVAAWKLRLRALRARLAARPSRWASKWRAARSLARRSRTD